LSGSHYHIWREPHIRFGLVTGVAFEFTRLASLSALTKLYFSTDEP